MSKEIVEKSIKNILESGSRVTPYKVHLDTGLSFKEIQHYWSVNEDMIRAWKKQLKDNEARPTWI